SPIRLVLHEQDSYYLNITKRSLKNGQDRVGKEYFFLVLHHKQHTSSLKRTDILEAILKPNKLNWY
ncbi:hypothetical protein ACJX0J_019113, partial [Zea mays]